MNDDRTETACGHQIERRRATGLACVIAVLMTAGCDGADDSGQPATERWFVEAAHELAFRYDSGAGGDLAMPEIMGAGVALFDYDDDGDLDVYLTNGNRSLPGASPGRATNRLFRQDSDGRFVDVTAESGLGDEGYGMGVAVGDIDNDGHADVFVTNFGPARMYRNRGDGTFVDVTGAAGAAVDGWSTSATFCDLDLDGFLDLYVARYVAFDPRRRCDDQAGRPIYCGPLSFKPLADVLLLNNGDGTFVDVTAAAGIAGVAAAGLGVVCEELTGDGWPDLYVANDAYANNLWVNRGDGTFRDEGLVRGIALNANGQAEAGMGVVAADLDGDLAADLFVTHLAQETNTLYRNLTGGRGFRDSTGESSLAESSMVYTGFGVAAFDAEHDGDLDLVIANGRVLNRDRAENDVNPSVAAPWDRYAEPNLFYRNAGAGKFELDGGALADRSEISRGLAIGDLDADGDLDWIVANIESPVRVYRNEAPRSGAWLQVRALDPALDRDAIGARVFVDAGDRRWVRTVTRGYSYLSSSEPVAHFGLGDVDGYDAIVVHWPDGSRETFPGQSANRRVVVVRGEGEAVGD